MKNKLMLAKVRLVLGLLLIVMLLLVVVGLLQVSPQGGRFPMLAMTAAALWGSFRLMLSGRRALKGTGGSTDEPIITTWQDEVEEISPDSVIAVEVVCRHCGAQDTPGEDNRCRYCDAELCDL